MRGSTRSAQTCPVAMKSTISRAMTTPHSTKFHGGGNQIETIQSAAVTPL